MATNAKNAPTDINKQEDERQQDNTRMTFAGSPASTPTSTSTAASVAAITRILPQQKRRQEQCNAKILQELLGIVAQPQEATTLMQKPDAVVAADKQKQQEQNQQSHMELSQIELIYRAEGNANLVLALPQFKKVLRLPKTSTTSHSNNSATEYNEMKIGNTQQQTDVVKVAAEGQRQVAGKEWQLHQEHRQQGEQQQQQQQQKSQEMQSQHQPQQQQQKQQEVVQSASEPAVNQNAKDLTMEDFVAYIEVIRNLLGSEYVLETEIVRIAKAEDIRWINERIRADRPAHRRDKEFCGEFGLLLPDATRLPIAFDILLSNLQTELIGDTYAVEIKPKQGWPLPADVVVNDLFDLRRKPTRGEPAAAATAATSASEQNNAANNNHIIRCRYCAMQFLKLRAGKINRRSSYCPLALFSGDPSKMKTAIDALLQCPQNNLRIFRNGILIYDGEKHSYVELVENIFPGSQIELLKDLLVACLLRDYTASSSSSSNNNIKEPSISNIISVDDTVDVVEVAKAAAGQPHLSATSAPSSSGVATKTKESLAMEKHQQQQQQQVEQQQRKKKKKLKMKMKESNVMATHQPTAAQVTYETAPHTPTEAKATKETATAKTDTVALETTSQAQITEVEMLCLPKNCVLQTVLHLQLLAKHNMSALHAAGFAHKSEKSYNALKSLLQRSYHHHHHDHKQQQQQQQQQPVGDELKPVEAYLLGATVLDCSIMLAFQEISMRNQEPPPPSAETTLTTSSSLLSKHCVTLPRHAKGFLTKVTLVDLDPKPDSHLCKYIKQTCQALNLFMDSSAT